MSYPLIILGAGASLDFQDLQELATGDANELLKWQPPLTNGLFSGQKFDATLANYKEMNGLVADIRGRIRQGGEGVGFEKILTEMYEKEVKNDPNLYKSFGALLFYLSELFSQVSTNYYRPHNNYAILINQLRQAGNGGKALFVNFNYDLLLERELGIADAKNIDEYISHPHFPVVKIHGACNWYWNVQIHLDADKPNYDVVTNIAKDVFLSHSGIKDSRLRYIGTRPYSEIARQTMALTADTFQGTLLYPALAIPLFGKSSLPCPQSHLAQLKSEIKNIDRVIIIGWKVGDPFLRDLLIEELGERDIPIAFVGGKNTNQTIIDLDKKIQSNITLRNDVGFSNFITSNTARGFLRQEI